jgi:CheY-like chemotaxis protein
MRPVSIALVEDDSDSIELTRSVLKSARITNNIVAYRTGRDAIRELEDNPSDIILLDIRLPDISGWDVLVALKSMPSLNKSIFMMLSAHMEVSPVHLESGLISPDYFISKPFDPLQFVLAMQALDRFSLVIIDEDGDEGN